MTEKTHRLDGNSLTEAALADIAAGAPVTVDEGAFQTMAATHLVVQKAIAEGKPVYGVTTGLGPKVVQKLSAQEITEFSLNTIRGRAHSVGDPLPRSIVRAALAVRLNTLLKGVAGASPDVARHILACLNTDLVPRIGGTTSIGAADLMWGGSMGLALIGEGRFLGQSDNRTSGEALEAAGIAPLCLGPRDGLALASHSSFSAAYAALGLQRAKAVWDRAQTAAALSLEGFRGNLTPFRADVLALRPGSGAAEAAMDLMERLRGSDLLTPGAARRLQDPLSFRNIAQVHGSLHVALMALEQPVLGEINGASDSPVVLPATGEIVSSGNFLNPYLSVALTGANQAMVQAAAQITARIARMLANRFTDLPNGLNDPAAGNAGLGPLTKVSEALFAEILQLAAPAPIYPSISADGVEDTINYAALNGRALLDICDRMATLIAVEMIVAAQAIQLRDVTDGIAPGLQPALAIITGICPRLEADRPLSDEIEDLAKALPI